MDFLLEALTNWLKEMLVSAIMGNLSGMFESVNNQVGEIATSVGMTPAIGRMAVSEICRIMEKTPAFQSAGVVPTCVAISPTL